MDAGMTDNSSTDLTSSLVLTLTPPSAGAGADSWLQYVSIGYMALRCLWGVFALIGNGLTMGAVYSNPVLHTNSNYLICSLCMADLFIAFNPITELLSKFHPHSQHFLATCYTDNIISLISLFGNGFNILFIAVDRLLFVAFPLRYKVVMTARYIFFGIMSLWFVICVQTVIIMVFFADVSYGSSCSSLAVLHRATILYFILPQWCGNFLVTFLCYSMIAFIASKQKRKIISETQNYNSAQALLLQKQNKITKMMFKVLLIYSLGNILEIIMAAILVNYRLPGVYIVERVAMLVYISNSWINPIIYAWSDETFRITFCKMFRNNAIGPDNGNPNT